MLTAPPVVYLVHAWYATGGCISALNAPPPLVHLTGVVPENN